MTNEMRDFLTSWLKWAESDSSCVDNPHGYSGDCGLCDSVVLYKGPGTDSTLTYELARLFRNDGLDGAFPFGQENYLARWDNDIQHLCPIRLAWVRTKLEEVAP